MELPPLVKQDFTVIIWRDAGPTSRLCRARASHLSGATPGETCSVVKPLSMFDLRVCVSLSLSLSLSTT